MKEPFQMKSYEITSAAALAAISASLQLVHIGWMSPWGMWLDLVAIPWLIAYFLYGGRSALIVSLVGALIITFLDPSTWLGALMKWLATLPMWLAPIVTQKVSRMKLPDFRKPLILLPILAAAIMLRAAITIPVNYYFAIPIWTGLSTVEAMSIIPWWAILLMNAAQGVIEVAVAWLLVFRFRLDRFAAWQSK